MASGGGGGRGAGLGRGGRGAALLQALASSQKPGSSEEKQLPASQLSAAGAAPVPSVAPSAAPLGRGSLLAGLKQSLLAKQQQQQQQLQQQQQQQQQRQQEETPQPVPQRDEPPAKPMGRGLAAMKALL
ncbi:POU domain, class 3, transcription factor 2 [Aplysia californica]|uniref:POU domain, class 3, transcription factor 2 n=1 Tax=Aplysia californica TaxID=6500 RepID=A0ABM1AAL3_APLCA|nr:POU domain, class 3, transcription factor 2 [Aplysia californica]